MTQTLIFDEQLIRRYNQAGPRYTSYPTAVQFHPKFDHTRYAQWLKASNEDLIPPDLSLYVHLPFCDTVCYYCACNKIITNNHKRVAPYLEHLYLEIKAQASLADHDRKVKQLHWGGGTPTFLSEAQMTDLMTVTQQHFNLYDADEGEYSIEVDPRRIDTHLITHLRELGFNRMSLGVQDFDASVQKAVNRIQSEQETLTILHAAQAAQFKSINMDLIYGLPRQSIDSFAITLDKIIAANPDRLSLFNYAHLPHLFKVQRQINEDELPSAADKLTILKHSIQQLTDVGYIYVGMDHFAKPDDELVIAQENGTLYRNFQGYSTHADCDLIGLGVTAIGKVGSTYSQNRRNIDDYYHAVKNNQGFAVFRGIELNFDDLLRREIISQLICNFQLNISSITNEFPIDFSNYFANELSQLKIMSDDGLLQITNDMITVLPRGRLLIRNICMVFDHYLQQPQTNPNQYSKVI